MNVNNDCFSCSIITSVIISKTNKQTNKLDPANLLRCPSIPVITLQKLWVLSQKKKINKVATHIQQRHLNLQHLLKDHQFSKYSEEQTKPGVAPVPHSV